MKPSLFAHPFSSYCQKVLIALYENHTPFTYRSFASDDAATGMEFAKLWPLQKMPLLLDEGRAVIESSIIIEYLSEYYPGPNELIPRDRVVALETRSWDRFFDNYVMTPMQKIVGDRMRPSAQSDNTGVADSRQLLEKSYQWLEAQLEGKMWATGAGFGLADCAAAPALFYADWVHPIPASLANL